MELGTRPRILVVGKGYRAYRGYNLDELHDAGFEVWLCDDEPLEPQESALVHELIHVDFSKPAATEAARVADRLHGVTLDHGMCYIESLLAWSAEFFAALDVPFLPPAQVGGVRSKEKMRNAFSSQAMNTPWHRCGAPQELLDADVPYPAVVKPEEGFSSIGVELIDGPDALREYFERANNVQSATYVLEGVLQGREFSIEGYVKDHAPTVTGLTFKFKTPLPFFEELGQFCTREAVVPPAYHALFAAAARAAGVESSILHFEFLDDDGHLTPIEIAARPAGDKIPYLHRRISGNSLLLEYLGRPVQYPTTGVPGIGIVFFVPAQPGTISSDFDPAAIAGELGESFIECHPGKVVKTAPEDFFTRLGFSVICGATMEEFVTVANSDIEVFQRATGIELHRLTLDHAAELTAANR